MLTSMTVVFSTFFEMSDDVHFTLYKYVDFSEEHDCDVVMMRYRRWLCRNVEEHNIK